MAKQPSGLGFRDRFRQSPELVKVGSSVLVGEIIGATVAMGVFWADDKILQSQKKAVTDFIAHKLFLPRLELIEQFADNVFVNKQADIDKRQHMTREERAFHIAEIFFSNALASAIALPLAVRSQHMFDKHIAGSERDFWTHTKSRFIDGTVHLGTAATMHSLFRKQTRWVADTMESVLHKVGLSQESAHEVANFMTRIQVPGLVGNGARVIALLVSGSDKSR